MSRFILKFFVILLEAGLVLLGALLLYFSEEIELKSSYIYLPSGSISKVIEHLDRSGISMSVVDLYALRFIGQPQKGWIDLKTTKMSRYDFLRKITTSKAALFKVSLIPGETTYIVLEQLRARYGYDIEKLKKAYEELAPYPEGVFFAETYFLPLGINERSIIKLLLNEGLKKHKALSYKVFGKFDQKRWFERVVTIASIIQKEAASEEEMPLIASVIYNRLKIGMPLQMDGTLNYGKFSHQKVTPERIREDTSKFNTYKHKGLPPYPVCIVGVAAIKAALHPAKTNYLYFVKSEDGNHLFSSTYKKHLSNIQNGKK
ncbi:MAG: endolytic transglycosylase MltG [Epsilonproteobacteria bacterium]|nr:endolytic transglycosylase MltG [Campylobacterota bacterium]